MSKFKVGDKVFWESQAAASRTRKEGTVYDIVRGTYKPDPRHYSEYSVMFDGDGSPRGHESYLIEVPGGKTAKASPRLYWPRVSQLRLVKQD